MSYWGAVVIRGFYPLIYSSSTELYPINLDVEMAALLVK